MSTRPITDLQKSVLDFIVNHISEEQRPPRHREIKTKFGWESNNAATVHINALRHKGYLHEGPHIKVAGLVVDCRFKEVYQ